VNSQGLQFQFQTQVVCTTERLHHSSMHLEHSIYHTGGQEMQLQVTMVDLNITLEQLVMGMCISSLVPHHTIEPGRSSTGEVLESVAAQRDPFHHYFHQ
jgi:hypothetical protein